MSSQERLVKLNEQKTAHLSQALKYKKQMQAFQQKGETKNAEKLQPKLNQELIMARQYNNLILKQNAILLNSERASRDPEFKAQWLKGIETALAKSRARQEVDNDNDSDSDKEEFSESDEKELEELSEEPIQCSRRSPSRSRSRSRSRTT